MGSRFLVVSALKENIRALRSIEGCALAGCVTEALSGAQARRLMGERLFVNVVIDTPLPDEAGAELALYAASKCSGGVVLFAKKALAAELEAGSAGRGIIVIPKPIDREALRLSLQALEIMRGKISLVEEENRRLRTRLDEEKLVCRAKCLLIKRYDIGEAGAHRDIEKRAMDSRRSKRDVADEIIAREILPGE